VTGGGALQAPEQAPDEAPRAGSLLPNAIPGGFQLGPFSQLYPPQWLDAGRLYIHASYGGGSLLAGEGAEPKFVGLAPRGAPGPASIEGVRGPYVLVVQGHRGRHLYDCTTGRVHPADESWNPVD